MKFKYVKKFEEGGSIKDFTKSDAYNSSLASIVKMIDPTGISSYGDVYNAWTDGKTDYNDFLEPLAALPLIGKAGKALKLIPKLEKLGSVGKYIKNLSEYSDAKKNIEQINSTSKRNYNRIKRLGMAYKYVLSKVLQSKFSQ